MKALAVYVLRFLGQSALLFAGWNIGAAEFGAPDVTFWHCMAMIVLLRTVKDAFR